MCQITGEASSENQGCDNMLTGHASGVMTDEYGALVE
jgi:hypothetical protein